MVCNPEGGSFDLVEEDELRAGLKRSDGFLAWFREPPILHVASAEEILDRALAWRKTCSQSVTAEDFSFAERYHGSLQEQISLHYGLMNGHVQMEKTIQFFKSAGLLPGPVCERLLQMLAGLPEVWRNGRYDLLHQLDETLWTALEKAR